MDLSEVKKLIEELMETSITVYLSTIDYHGFPITRALFNTRNKKRYPEFSEFFNKLKDKYVMYFSTNTSSSKVDHIRKNPKTSVYICDPQDFKGVMFGGDVEILEDMDIKRQFWLNRSVRYYPKGVEDPDYTILHFKPRNVIFYYKLQRFKFDLEGS
jgi:general stress protein 26